MSYRALVACEESQRVTIELRKRGWEAYSCDIQEPSGGRPEWHILGDALKIIYPTIIHRNIYSGTIISTAIQFETMDGRLHAFTGKWDLIIAHPPCTYLSNAGACRLYPRKGQLDMKRYEKGMKAKNFFMEFYNAPCDHICVENPVPSKIFMMPNPTQTIQPYQYGDPFSKRTCLWLRGLPRLKATEVLTEWKPWISPNTCANKGRPEKRGVAKNAKERSKTFPGIAKAMAEQWTRFIETGEDGDDQIRMVSV